MSLTSSAVLADSVSDSSEQECEQSPSASGTSSAAPSSASTGQESPASKTFAPLTQADWIGLDESISSVVAFPASHLATPESRRAKQTTVTSGRRCAKSLHSRDPLGSLEKMLLGSSRWHSTMCWLTWKVSATPRGRLLFRLVPSELTTDATGFGSLLATPTVKANQLAPSMQKWPSCAALLPTPRANMHTGVGQRGKGGPNLQTVAGGSLNPTWVEWLMGFPEGWTALEPSEMPSSRRSSKKSGARS